VAHPGGHVETHATTSTRVHPGAPEGQREVASDAEGSAGHGHTGGGPPLCSV